MAEGGPLGAGGELQVYVGGLAAEGGFEGVVLGFGLGVLQGSDGKNVVVIGRDGVDFAGSIGWEEEGGFGGGWGGGSVLNTLRIDFASMGCCADASARPGWRC